MYIKREIINHFYAGESLCQIKGAMLYSEHLEFKYTLFRMNKCVVCWYFWTIFGETCHCRTLHTFFVWKCLLQSKEQSVREKYPTARERIHNSASAWEWWLGRPKYCAGLFMPRLKFSFCFFQERERTRKSGAHQRFHSVSFLENVRGAGFYNPLIRLLLHGNHS